MLQDPFGPLHLLHPGNPLAVCCCSQSARWRAEAEATHGALSAAEATSARLQAVELPALRDENERARGAAARMAAELRTAREAAGDAEAELRSQLSVLRSELERLTGECVEAKQAVARSALVRLQTAEMAWHLNTSRTCRGCSRAWRWMSLDLTHGQGRPALFPKLHWAVCSDFRNCGCVEVCAGTHTCMHA
eukprot:366548-Chlamydomonas_euryale.AAC.12